MVHVKVLGIQEPTLICSNKGLILNALILFSKKGH